MNPRYFQEIIFRDREMFLIKSLISVKFIQAICTHFKKKKKVLLQLLFLFLSPPETTTVIYQSSKRTSSLLA